MILASCGPRPQDCARSDVFCVGLVTDFGTAAEGINHDAWLGLQDAKTAGLADRIDRIETADMRDRAANIAAFGEAGYDVIVTVGASISEETLAAAHEYPRSLFVGIEQPQGTRLTNLVGLIFHEEQSGFLAGALAALMTQTGRVAAVCEAHYVDAMRRYCEGFRSGAKYVASGVDATVSYRDGATESLFRDPGWGRATAIDEIDAGADIIFAAGGATADAALRTAAANGALVIGTETDQYARLEDIRPRLLTSAVNEIRAGVLELVRLARAGKMPTGEYWGQVGLAPFHDLDGLVPAPIKGRVIEVERGLEDGTIQIDVPYKSE